MGDEGKKERQEGREKIPELKELTGLLADYQRAYEGAIREIASLEERSTVQEKARNDLEQLRKEIQHLRTAESKEKKEGLLSPEERNLMALIVARKDLDPLREKIRGVFEKNPKKRAAIIDTIFDRLEGAQITDYVLQAELMKAQLERGMSDLVDEFKKGTYGKDIQDSLKAIHEGKRPRKLEYAKDQEFPAMPQEIVFKMFLYEEMKNPESPLRKLVKTLQEEKKTSEFPGRSFDLFQVFLKGKSLEIKNFCPDQNFYQKLCDLVDVVGQLNTYDIQRMALTKALDESPHLRRAKKDLEQHLEASHFHPLANFPGGIQPDMRNFSVVGVPVKWVNGAVDKLGKWMKPENLNDPTRWTADSMLLGAVQLGGALTVILNVGGAVFAQVWQGGKMVMSLAGRDFKQALRHIPLIGKDARKALKESLPFGRILIGMAGYAVAQGVIDPERWDHWLKGRGSFDGVIDTAAVAWKSPWNRIEGLKQFWEWVKKNGKDFTKDAAEPFFHQYLSDPAVDAKNWSKEKWMELKEWASDLQIVDRLTFPFEKYEAYFAIMRETKEFAINELNKKNQKKLADNITMRSKGSFDSFLISYLYQYEKTKINPQISIHDLVKAGFLTQENLDGVVDLGPLTVEKLFADKLLEQGRWVRSERQI